MALRPSLALAAHREEVRQIFAAMGLAEPEVFGSVARGEDADGSDLDLLVEFTEDHDIVDLLALEHELEALLAIDVDIVDSRASGRVTTRDLVDFGADAAYTVSLGLDAFLADGPPGRVLRNNARHIVIQVATVVERLPDDFKRTYSDIDWVAIARMRNLISHHYDRVDDRLMFTTLQRRVPDLLDRLGLQTGS